MKYKVYVKDDSTNTTVEHANRTPGQVAALAHSMNVGDSQHIRKVLERSNPTLLVIPVTGRTITVARQKE